MLALRNMTIADLNSANIITRAAYGVIDSRYQLLLRNLCLQSDGWFLAFLDYHLLMGFVEFSML